MNHSGVVWSGLTMETNPYNGNVDSSSRCALNYTPSSFAGGKSSVKKTPAKKTPAKKTPAKKTSTQKTSTKKPKK